MPNRIASLSCVVVLTMALGPAAAPPLIESGEAPPSRALSHSARWHDDARLGYYLTVRPDRPQRQVAIDAFRTGLAAISRNEPKSAIAAFEWAAVAYPYVADWARAFAADAAARGGDTTAVRRLQAEVGPTLATEWGWLAQVRSLNRAGDRAGALTRATALIRVLESEWRRAAAWEIIGHIHLERGDTAAARGAFRTAIQTQVASTGALDAARALSGLRSPTPDDRLAAGRVFLRHGNVDRGVEGLEAYLNAGRGTAAERAIIRLELGRGLYDARRFPEAAKRLLRAADGAPEPAIAAEALYLAGRAQYRDGREDDARATFARALRSYPSTPATGSVHFYLGDLDQDDGRYASAKTHFRAAIKAQPSGAAAAQSYMRLGIMAMVESDAASAARVFDEYRQSQSARGARQQAAYWAGRALRQAGRDSLARVRLVEARDLDPIDYYGFRAADLLGAGGLKAALIEAPVTGPAAIAKIENAVLRLDFLEELELSQASAFEMQRLRRHFQREPGAIYALAEAYGRRGETYRAIRLGREMLNERGAWDSRLLRIVYPMPYRAEIQRHARSNGLDPYLVAGLIRQESMFSPTARSGPGALGLMQVMPKTGKLLADRVGMRRFAESQLISADVNLRLGTMYLRDMIRQHGGIVETLAAYNAGPTRMARWRGFPERKDPELLTERIPYEETREYVKIVQRNARLYETLYAD